MSLEPAARRVAAIDCGTNSIRLLVADVDPVHRTLTDIDRRLEIVRLGQGVDATGRLAPDALERTLGALREYAGIIAASQVSAVRMVATSATRDASNAAGFTRGVLDVLGVAPEVLTGDEEAWLSFAGATAEFGSMEGADEGGMGRRAGGGEPPAAPYLVLDIGGGSTEFVLGGDSAGDAAGEPGDGVSATSMNIGCVRMTERHLHADPPSGAQIAAATTDIDAALSTAAEKVDIARAKTLVGLAGSVTTVAAVALGLPGYDAMRIHHSRISAARVHEVTTRLLAQTRAERAAIPSMHPGRIDVIGGGALVLDRVMERFGFPEVVVSEHDILDGIAWSLVPA